MTIRNLIRFLREFPEDHEILIAGDVVGDILNTAAAITPCEHVEGQVLWDDQRAYNAIVIWPARAQPWACQEAAS